MDFVKLPHKLPGNTFCSHLVDTYSIVAYDPENSQLGVAVQSHYFAVGKVVPWAEPGVGVVATQAWTDISYGPLGLSLMRAGKPAKQALDGLLAADLQPEMRQVAMIDAQGNVGVHTGSGCVEAAGHHLGTYYSTQANLMRNETVWQAMGHAFESTQGDLASRLMAALYAAEAEGGDIRGKQSAALVVVTSQPSSNPWQGRLFDLRVDDDPDPLKELERLLSIARAYHHGHAAINLLVGDASNENSLELARSEFTKALEAASVIENDFEIIFHFAVALAVSGRLDEAIPLFRKAFTTNPIWREVVPRLVRSNALPIDPELLSNVMDQI